MAILFEGAAVVLQLDCLGCLSMFQPYLFRLQTAELEALEHGFFLFPILSAAEAAQAAIALKDGAGMCQDCAEEVSRE